MKEAALTTEDDVLVGPVLAVVSAIAGLRLGDALVIAALELVVRARVFVDVGAERRLVARIAAVVVAVAVERLQKKKKINNRLINEPQICGGDSNRRRERIVEQRPKRK